MGQQTAVYFSRTQFVSQAVNKRQSLPVEDSLFPQQSANGSLFQQKTVCSLSHNRVYKWQSFSAEDSLIPGRSQQMAVFFSRRQFAHFHPAGSTNGSLSQ